MTDIFIDGKEGTTGLQIFDRLAERTDVRVITLPEELRKDPQARAGEDQCGGRRISLSARCGGAGIRLPL